LKPRLFGAADPVQPLRRGAKTGRAWRRRRACV